MKKMNRIISMLLCVCMMLGVMPVSAFAAESTGNTLDSGMDDPTIGSSGQEPEETGDAPIHWLQQYQEAALAQMQRPATYAMQRASGGSPSYSMIEWSGGQLQFANGAYLGSPMPQIYFNGGTAFCAEWNGEHPAGSYSNAGEGSDSTIKQILANYDASGGSDADYAAAQAAIWAHLMGTSVSSWGGCPGSSAYSEMVNGDADYSGLTYTLWGGGTQKILTYEIAEDPDLPEEPEEPEEPPTEEEYPPDEYEIIVETETETETEVRNRKSYEYSDAIGQITIRKHDQNGDSLDDALFDIDVAFSDGSHHTVENWEVDNGARLFTWTHPQDNHDPATVTITEVQAPNGYSMDPTPKTVTVAPTYTRVTHVETWTVTTTTETTTSTVVEITSGEVVAESESSSSSETESEPQVEEFADFIEGDREITVTFVNTEMPCSLTIYKHETGNKNIALEGATFRIRYADPSVSAQTWTMTTDANGEIHIALPAEGALIVEELFAPEGYVMTSKTTYDITVMKGENKVIEIPNDKKTQLIAVKKDAQTGELLAGASIRATLLRSNTEPFESGQTYTETTGADGRAVFSNLIPGEYRVEEISPPQYYQGTSVVHTVNILEGNSETVTVQFENEPWTGLTIKKLDATNAKGLPGAIFKVYKGSEEDPKAYLGDWESGANGSVTIQNLEPGYYTVVESQAPDGYLLDEENRVQTIEIKSNAVDENITIVFQNNPKPKLLIEKVDGLTGEPLEGAVFRIARRDSAEYLEVTTGRDGTVLVEDLEHDWYTVTEITAPEGYLLDSAHRDVELIPGKTTTLVIDNFKQPGVLIEKIDADTGAKLAGAVFHIARRDSDEYIEVTTGADGTVLVDGLAADWYTVTEVKAPDGYILDSSHYDVEFIPGEVTSLVIQNHQQPDLTIRKVDEQTGKGLPGAVLRITKDGAREYRDVTTGADGVVVVEDLDAGWYIVEELNAPDGYLLDSTPHYIELVAGKDSELVIKNRHKPSLEILKTDSVTGQPLAGVLFEVKIKNGKTLGEYSTDAAGRIYLEDIDPELYVITEIKVPDGYIMETGSKEALVEWGKVVTVEFKNQPRNPILIHKVDTKTGEPLEGAKFMIQEVNGAFVAEMETGRNGYITVTGIDPGFYTVKEIKAPRGYILDETPKTVELKADEPAVVEFENQPLNGLHIKKIDSETQAPLENAKFRVSEKNGRLLGEYTTDNQGEIIIDDLQPGWYTISEIAAPDGYRLDNTPKDVEFVWGEFVTVEFTNELLSPILIKKVDAETGAPLAGALFKVTKADGEFVGEFTTGTDGFLNVPELEPGFYIVSELRAPEGYQLDQTPVTVEVKASVPTLVEFVNNRLPGLQVQKIDAETKEPLAGAKFRVERSNGERVGDFVTNSAGFFVVTDLEADTYVVYETAAPAGYILDTTLQNVVLKPNETATLEFSNKPLAGLQIKKVDDVTGEPLAGVEFTITELDGAIVGSFVTDDTGLIFVLDLLEGWYVVSETRPLEGYKPDTAPRNVEVLSGKLNVVEYRNQPYPHLQILKVDSETKQPLEGVKFSLSDHMGRGLGSFTTNAQGMIHLTGMDAGVYFVQEVEAVPGYVLDSTAREIELLWGKTTKLEIPNTPMGTLLLKKVDAETGQPLYGAAFILYDSKNNIIGEYTTDNNGMIEFPRSLAEGKYKIKEIKAPEGYVLDDVPKTIEIKSGETLELEIPNEPMRGQIQIVKKSADDNPITKEKAGTLLEGAEFEVYNERLEVVDTITTDERGVAITKELPMDTYGIKEIAAPEYYLTDGSVFYATLKIDGDLVRFEVLNESIQVEVTVEKSGNMEVLAGDIMSYDFSNIRNNSNVALDEFYWHDQLPDEVRIGKIVTGTWSERLTYAITYRTNKNEKYQVLEDGLSSEVSHTLDCGSETLGLADGEYVTDIRFEFGTVQPGFCEEEKPVFYVTTLANLADGYRVINRTDVGGKIGDEWVMGKDTWITVVLAQERGDLPKTGV